MNYLSLFSGMEAAHLAWSPLGWRCKGVAEIDPAACALLRHRLPHVPNLGSVTDITDEQIRALGPLDVVIGGSPCQDLSVAGKRAGLGGARSGLFHHQLRIFNAARYLCGARWLVWENVPGAFSSNKGRDFAVVVGALAGSELTVPADGWSNEGVALGDNGLVEWSVLDAQWFGVAQRRRRVFAVLDTGDWAGRPPVLIERNSLRGDFAPNREPRQSVAGSLTASAGRRGGVSDPERGQLIAYGGNNTAGPIEVGTCLNACASASGRLDFESETFLVQEVAHTLRGEGFDASEGGTGRGTPLVPVAFSHQAGGVQTTLGYDPAAGTSMTLSVGQTPALHIGQQVRRLTPRECERLQGATDDWTLVPNAAGKPMADGPRYKMLGNSFAVPVIHWIGESIQRAHTWALQERAA
ncbi:DNA cytosine methyltransferase [Xanthomonas arboricola]|uniref:DNA cytosine methyltransferase n=1 Tax=Xanthomonas arboricola TaxID=56448 RepID=UPI000CEF2523|nr:DNA cytosine methyltransferase [Xanthomonas arboricola]PPT26848.1 hypothetical protein XarbCFBP7614_14760 [Xanthomonas arboricola]